MKDGKTLPSIPALLALSDDVQQRIFACLDVADLCALERVCAALRDALSPAAHPVWAECCRAVLARKQLTPSGAGMLTPSKATLARAWTDARRSTITFLEVAALTWRLRFICDIAPLHMSDHEREALADEPPAKLSFGLDGFYTSDLRGAPSSTRPLRWRLRDGGLRLQIGAFPPLNVRRTDDWGWAMRNRFVEFYTVTADATR